MKTSPVPIALQQAVWRCLRQALQRANQRLTSDYPEPSISWRQRGTIAGSAWYSSWQIRLNPILLQENPHTFIEQVVPHELAHLLVWRHFGHVAPHGKEWQWMMAEVLGIAPQRTHQFSVTSVSGETFSYHCNCRQHQLTLRRHNKVARQQSEYRCRHCSGLLKYGKFSGS